MLVIFSLGVECGPYIALLVQVVRDSLVAVGLRVVGLLNAGHVDPGTVPEPFLICVICTSRCVIIDLELEKG